LGVGFAVAGDDRPLVDEEIEVKRMRRLEAIRAARPYNAIVEDGSGWVTVAAPEEQAGGSTRAAGMTRRRRSGEVLGARTVLLHVGGSGVTHPHLRPVMLLGRTCHHRGRGRGARTHHRQRATVQLIRMTCHHHRSPKARPLATEETCS